MQSQCKACRGWCTTAVKRCSLDCRKKAWRTWLSISPKSRCRRDFFLTGCILISVPVRQTGDRGIEMSSLRQKLSPSREAGQKSIRKDKTYFCRFQPKHHCHWQQAIVYISTSGCYDLFLSLSASIACPFSLSSILLYLYYQICVTCWSFLLAWPSLELKP